MAQRGVNVTARDRTLEEHVALRRRTHRSAVAPRKLLSVFAARRGQLLPLSSVWALISRTSSCSGEWQDRQIGEFGGYPCEA
jgi:hypothetical protein